MPVFVLVFVHTSVVPVFVQTCGNGVIEGDEECDDGNSVGGDLCAANCTHEDRRVCQLGPGSQVVPTFAGIGAFGTISLFGTQTLTTGHARSSDPSGQIPIVVKATDIQIAPISSAGSCVCIRAVPMASAGSDTVATGTLSCTAGGLPQVDYIASRDHNTHLDVPNPDASCSAGMVEDGSPAHPHAGACNSPEQVTYTASAPAGAAAISYNLVLYMIADACVSRGPGAASRPQGADGIPCTADDPAQPAASVLLAATGTATAKILHANDMAKTFQVPVLTGHALDCARLAADPTGGLEGAAVVGGLFTLDVPQFGDEIDAYTFACEAPTAASPTPSSTRSPTSLGTPTATPTVPPASTNSPTGTPTMTVTRTFTATRTPTPSSTPTTTATGGSSPSASPTPIPCVGDCDGNGHVAVGELVKGVNVALGNALLDQCPAFNCNRNGHVTVDCLVKAVNAALTVCPNH